MKLFFGDAIQDMVAELRAQAVQAVRIHVLTKADGQSLHMQTYVTTFHNNQIYEAVVESSASLAGVEKDKVAEFVREKCEQARQKVARHLAGFDMRPGILQD
ncbi:MAG: hypothetical protein QGH74_06385 [Candidatus Brocadiia bacterium]|jgi:hypothetical protein|nr:hypothetical protein [Candidatus Brocadiia bacterium]